ncbi:FtsK/SpoIIIE domain-containing protein [Pseudonocardia nigra]|uniref:FtsK/SpoIIIE domain-containing protein n=1 Tax=Pseudonocardia nigra TaxID=1921578 RepID=UPI001C5E1AB1|nr:FtsK/SpoIIIE domain-containing protein [Pseudonocardia nigra]
MTIEPHDPAPVEAPPKTPLSLVKPDQPPTPVVDTSAPIRPEWLRDRETFRSTSRNLARRNAYRAIKWVFYLPGLLGLLVLYSPRGLARVTAALARWVYDQDSAQVRHQHAANTETPEYTRVHAVRKANLHARGLVFATGALAVVGPILAWTYPYALSAIVGAAVMLWTIKVIPGKSPWEIVAAVGVGVAVWRFLPLLLERIPHPPVWAVWVAGAALVLTLGWVGRTRGKPLATRPEAVGPGIVIPLRAPMVREALCSLGIGGLRDPDTIRMLNDVHRHGPGVQVDLELPGGVTAASIVERRERLAAALKRELGCVWPSVGRRHAAHLSLYVCDEPLVAQRQKPWPLAEGREVDIFRAQPQATDQRGEWVSFTLAYSAVVIGAQPRMGKTFLLRQLLLVGGLDPRTKVVSLDGKGTGDLAPTRLFAHFYSVGDEPEEVEERVLPFLRELRAEMRRRAKFIRELPREECPESKVTSALADKYRDLAPWVIGMDETQAYFGYGEKASKAHKAIRDEIVAIVTDLAKRGPALGFITVLATQNVCEETIPRQIGTNAAIRAALKLFDHTTNDQVLGTGAYSRGIDATAFDIDDKGLMWLRADGDRPQIVRSVAGLDNVKSESIAAAARAIREAAGRLTGQAAGEEAAEEAAQVDLLDDCRQVFGTSRAMLLDELREALAGLRSETWAHLDNAALGAMLKTAGVKRGTVYSTTLKREGYGIKREWIDVAATADEDPDGEVIDLSERRQT